MWCQISLISTFLLAAFVIPARAADSPPALNLFIAPAGDDHSPGTPDHPFATLTRARDEIRARRAAAKLPADTPVTVALAAGDYPCTESFFLTKADSGTPAAPVIYRARDAESPRLIGGRRATGWKRVTDHALLGRLSPLARGNVWQCDLKASGIRDFGTLSSRGFARDVRPSHAELFFAGHPMTLAQYPNAGDFLHITGYGQAIKDEWGQETGKLEGGFLYSSDRPAHWAPSTDIWVHGYWSWDWANSYEHVAGLDPQKAFITTDKPYGNYNFRKGQRFYFLNVLEELDTPGEYYIDRAAGTAYFWPPQGQENLLETSTLVSELATPLISLDGASHITLRGLTLECARGDAIQIKDGTANLVAGCTLRNLGNRGVVIAGGTNHTVRACDIYHVGDAGISMDGGDRKTLTPANHCAENNHIWDFARWTRCYQGAVNAGGCGLRIAHNLIHDAPHTAILYWGNDFLIEANEIYSTCLETGDVGAIYTGRDYTFRGNVIRHNFLHHLGGVGMGSMGVYMDDCVSGHTIDGNIFWQTDRAVFLGGGRDHIVTNNIFVDCAPAIEIDSRGTDSNPVWHNMVYDTLKQRLEAMTPNAPPYSTRYPQLADLVPFYAGPKGIPPEHNRAERNVCVGRFAEAGWPKEALKYLAQKDNLVGPDPLFVDAPWGDFRLQPKSPAFKVGFQPIALDQIGLSADEYRLTLPARVQCRLDPASPGNVRLLVRNFGPGMAAGQVMVTARTKGVAATPVSVAFSLSAGATLERQCPSAGADLIEARGECVRPAILKISH